MMASRWTALADKARHSETDTWEPEACVKLLQMPTVHNYWSLKKILSECDATWMTDFLELSGLEVLFECLERLTHSSSMEDAVLQLNCVQCLRSIMNSQTGLDYIVSHSKYTRKLAQTLDTKNTVLKKQVFELLSAVCVYAPKGHDLAIDALEHYKASGNKRYRFAILVEELKQAEVLPYAAVVLGFINCIIISTNDIRQRLRIRNEFAGLGLLDLVSSLRNAGDDEVFIQCHVFERTKHADDEEALSRGLSRAFITHHELFVSIFDKVYNSPQCLTFLMVLQNLNRLNPDDVTSDLAWELLERVSDRLASSPVVPFYNAVGETLDCNFRSRTERSVATQTSNSEGSMDGGRRRLISLASDVGGDEVFEAPAAAGQRAKLNIFKFITHVSNLTRSRSFRGSKMQQAPERKSAKPASPVVIRRRTLETSSPSTAPKCTHKSPHATRVTKQSQANETRPQFAQSSPRSTQLTRSATLKAQGSPPSRRKRPPEPSQKESTVAAARPSAVQPAGPPGPLNGPVTGPAAPPAPAPPPPPPPPPPLACNSPPPPPPPPPMTPPPLSPLGDGLPVPSKPGKLPGPFHTLPKPQHKMKTLNWTKVPDTLVCGGQNIWSDVTREAEKEDVENSLNFKQVEELFCQKTVAPAEQKAANEKTKKEPTFISILDGKRSLNVCIFLKQFKQSPEAIVDLIRTCKSKDIGAERLRMLQKTLPESHELSMLQAYTGDRSKLGPAEQFFLLLGELKLYALYVDGLLQMEEFQPSVDSIRPQLDNYTTVCQEILTNKSLKEFLKLILITGNFINSGSYAGNAFGFRLNTLPKLLETRANKPRMTLLHYLVETAEKTNSNMLTFTKDLKHLAQCSRLSLDCIRADMKQLTAGITKLERHLKTASNEFKEQFGAFIEYAKSQLNDLNSQLLTISELSDRLADHFCEDKSRFSVEECLHIFNNFCEKVKLAQKENEERRIQEERAERLRSSRPISSFKNADSKVQPSFQLLMQLLQKNDARKEQKSLQQKRNVS